MVENSKFTNDIQNTYHNISKFKSDSIKIYWFAQKDSICPRAAHLFLLSEEYTAETFARYSIYFLILCLTVLSWASNVCLSTKS